MVLFDRGLGKGVQLNLHPYNLFLSSVPSILIPTPLCPLNSQNALSHSNLMLYALHSSPARPITSNPNIFIFPSTGFPQCSMLSQGLAHRRPSFCSALYG